MDSTPDITKTDQLVFIMRYMNQTTITERFIKCIPHVGHKAEDMKTAVLSVLEDLYLDIKNCRGQSYDNASNMAGIYGGLQAKIQDESNLAFFIPCGAHILSTWWEIVQPNVVYK